MNKKGFTLIELLIVISIMLIIVPATLPIYGNMQISSQLNENQAQVIQTLRLAREQSRAGLNNSAHGVYFEINADAQDKFILYQGDSYQTRATEYDQTTIIDAGISLVSTLAENDLNFQKDSGLPDNSGELFFNSTDNRQKTITINSAGFVESR